MEINRANFCNQRYLWTAGGVLTKKGAPSLAMAPKARKRAKNANV
jgi:hypothetical protein